MKTVPELVALDMAVDHRFADRVRTIWEAGDAVAPIDQRLSPSAKRRIIESLRPTRIISDDDDTPNRDGIPVEHGDALVVATSGSTGSPKAVIHTHSSIKAALEASATRLALTGDEHWLLCIPVSHVGGFLVLARHIVGNSSITIHGRFDVNDVVQAARQGATHVSLVATALARIDPDEFSLILLGGSAAPPALPPHVVVTYGMTETMGGFAYNGLPLPKVDVLVQNGEILVRGPMLMRSYRDGSHHRTADGFFPTGDLGELLPDGRLQVAGRRGDLIITGAEKVWPAAVESVLLTHPHVRDCVIRGIDDAEWGQRVVAFVVPAEATPSLDDIRSFVKRSLPPYCAPRELRIMQEIPRTALGKIDLGALLLGA
jgi:O-succinylbenzoic acid--CoA ligase